MLFVVPLSAQEKLDVFFDFNKSNPNSNSIEVLNQWIKQNATAEVYKMEGYCDTVDSKTYNLKLAERRIHTIEAILKLNKIKVSDKVERIPFGEDFNFSLNQDENRKVSFMYRILDEPIIETLLTIEEKSKEESTVEKIEKERISLLDKFEKAKIGDRIVINNIHFQFNSEIIIPESEPLVEQLLFVMELNPDLEIKVLGHICCNPDPKDTKLSYRRALKIFNYLRDNGIQLRRLAYKGFGSNEPVYPIPEKNEEEKIVNRRVEIEIVRK